MQHHFKFKRHQCPECGERFSQKKNLFGKGGHCSQRTCRQCGLQMTCLTVHRRRCPAASGGTSHSEETDDDDALPPAPAALDADVDTGAAMAFGP